MGFRGAAPSGMGPRGAAQGFRGAAPSGMGPQGAAQGFRGTATWDNLHTAGATISYQLSCSENHNNLWSTSEFYNSSNQVTACCRVLLLHFVILQGRSVSVLNAKLSTFVTVTGQNYESLKVVNRIRSTDCNILKFEDYRTGPFGPSFLGSPSELVKAKILLPVVYNYTTFRAMMSKDYPEIQHQFDPWHWIKVICNSLLSFLLRFE